MWFSIGRVSSDVWLSVCSTFTDCVSFLTQLCAWISPNTTRRRAHQTFAKSCIALLQHRHTTTRMHMSVFSKWLLTLCTGWLTNTDITWWECWLISSWGKETPAVCVCVLCRLSAQLVCMAPTKWWILFTSSPPMYYLYLYLAFLISSPIMPLLTPHLPFSLPCLFYGNQCCCCQYITSSSFFCNRNLIMLLTHYSRWEQKCILYWWYHTTAMISRIA